MDRFDDWMAEIERRHLADLTFSEVARALRALSATYVEKRTRIGEGLALSGAGKRAAFALFYGPLHYLLVRDIVKSIPGTRSTISRKTLVDLGCGTGAAGAAWASACDPAPKTLGIDHHPWAAKEAASTYRAFGLSARIVRADIGRTDLPPGRVAVLAAFALNELAADVRERILNRLLERAASGSSVLVVEPLAGFVAPWWAGWRARVEAAGGRADEWRVRVELPEIVRKLDRAAGLDHREITGRSTWMAGS